MYPIITVNEAVEMTETFWSMDDGIRLYTRIVVPVHKRKCPIVFVRSPYEEPHNGQPHRIDGYANSLFIKNGYALVEQQCRGTGDSEGVQVTHEEREDGLSTLKLIRKLPFYNGEVYLSGGSYLASVHYSYLDTNPEDVKGAVLWIQTDRMFFRNYRNGCNLGYCNLAWYLRNMKKRRFPNLQEEGKIIRPFKDLMKRIVGEDVPEYTNSLLNDTYSEYWKSRSSTYCMDNLKIPVLLLEGWYDCTIDGMFSMWERIPEETKRRSAFIVGPWPHATTVTADAEYPMPAGNIAPDYAVEWFNSLRDNKSFKYAELGRVNYYSVGGDYWTSTVYSRRASMYDKWYFQPDRSLSRLLVSALEKETIVENEISYVYDPNHDPQYFRLGPGICSNILKAKAPNSEEGIFSFESPSFECDYSYFGCPKWHMHVRSDCEDTMFYARLYFVEGEAAYNLTEAVTTISYWNPNYIPGEKQLLDIEFGHIAFTVKKGSRIRVDISSYSSVYVPHANVKGHWAEVAETKIANNTFVCDEDAYLMLPIQESADKTD